MRYPPAPLRRRADAWIRSALNLDSRSECKIGTGGITRLAGVKGRSEARLLRGALEAAALR